MTHRSALTLVSLSLVSIVASSCGSSNPPPPPGPECVALTSYVPTSTAPLSFATDIYPILTNTGDLAATMPGCSAASICHAAANPAANPPTTMQQLNAHGTAQYLSFIDPPATVLATLMTNSVNAPSMKRVVPSNVGQSFIAYKISGEGRIGLRRLDVLLGRERRHQPSLRRSDADGGRRPAGCRAEDDDPRLDRGRRPPVARVPAAAAISLRRRALARRRGLRLSGAYDSGHPRCAREPLARLEGRQPGVEDAHRAQRLGPAHRRPGRLHAAAGCPRPARPRSRRWPCRS